MVWDGGGGGSAACARDASSVTDLPSRAILEVLLELLPVFGHGHGRSWRGCAAAATSTTKVGVVVAERPVRIACAQVDPDDTFVWLKPPQHGDERPDELRARLQEGKPAGARGGRPMWA